jgi:hypothetical protein
VTGGSDSGSKPHDVASWPSVAHELYCKRCGTEMLFATATGKSGAQAQYDLFRCVACNFYDIVKVSG